ncbi:TniQ family protein [Sinorhizobium meliloti]|uniref:TniQ family protein n=1 Tax=Rhizobium meliloti TaxID=382 RepID=UPI002D78773D|nr:TniQ family protein [Sinorhizobium meliloti]
MLRQPSHDAGTSSRQLPVILAPHADELLSSWISRHASFYAIPPLGMLRHCLPEVSSLRSADRNVTATQVTRLAGIFSTEPATLRASAEGARFRSAKSRFGRRARPHRRGAVLL